MKSNRTLVLTFCLLAILGSGLADINSDFFTGASNMIGPDVNTGNLLAGITTNGGWGAKDDSSSNVDAIADFAIEINVIFFKFKIYPYARVRPLKFTSNGRITSLTFNNNVNSQSATVTANGFVAVRNGATVQIRQASGTATSAVNKAYTVQVVRKCRTILFWTDCWNENVNVERGLYNNELEAITSKLQREAAIALRNQITANTGLRASQLFLSGSLSSLYLDESNKLRSLYKQLEYDYSEINNVPTTQLVSTIHSASLGLITDGWIQSRIAAVASAAYRSSFIVAPTNTTFFVISVTNQGSSFLVRMSTFRVEGKLPTGAFLTSTGGWSIERYGEGASPSIHQIYSIFPPLK